MQVTLEKLRLSYFKGIKSIEMDFSEGENFIHGQNRAGKTTLFDSLWFLFFGKDSSGRADFSVKTYDKNNQIIPKVDHEVEGTFIINGQVKTFKRTLREQWSKSTNTLTGHTTDYSVDGFPVRTEKEFKEIIGQYFSEDLFKLLTNPLYFNSMKPADRRAVLVALVPEITDSDVFTSLPAKVRKSQHTKDLERLLSEGKKLDQIRLKAAQDKKTYRDEKDTIPGRIDEAERSKPEAVDYNELQEVIEGKKAELAEIDAQILEETNSANLKNKAIQEWQNGIFERKTKLQKLEFLAEQELRKFQHAQNAHPQTVKEKIESLTNQMAGKKRLINDKSGLIESSKSQHTSLAELLSKLTVELDTVRNEWHTENKKEFQWNGESCQACQRPFEGNLALDAEEKARAKFNTAKVERLKQISLQGNSIKQRIESTTQQIESIAQSIRTNQADIQSLNEQLESLKTEWSELETDLNAWYAKPNEGKTVSDFLSPEYHALKSEVETLEASKPEEVKPNLSGFQSNKQMIQNSLESMQKALGNKEIIDRTNKRIEELKQQEKDLAQKIASAEGIEEACFTFSKARMEQIESAINAKFGMVHFKMFEMQLNGNEKEICDTIFDGTPYSDVNNAGKIQAGLDIINTLSRHYNSLLPIFIDNRESVTWIPQVESQVVNLVVDPSATTLTNRQLTAELIEK